MRAPNIEFVTNRFVGDIEFDKAVAAGANVYDLELEGMRAIDRYTIQLKLKQPDYDLLDDLTSQCRRRRSRAKSSRSTATRRTGSMANPVGTGPYVLKEWRRAQKITLEASPSFREVYFPDSDDPADKEILAVMKGKRIPAIGRIEMNILEESNPRLLAFIKGELDISNPVPPGSHLQRARRQQQAQAGARQARHPARPAASSPSITFEYFNMDDPVVGGYSNEQIALRRAISMAYNVERRDRRRPARPGHSGDANDPAAFDRTRPQVRRPRQVRSRPRPRRCSTRFGYVDKDGDGWRDLPDGKPFSACHRQPDHPRSTASSTSCGKRA